MRHRLMPVLVATCALATACGGGEEAPPPPPDAPTPSGSVSEPATPEEVFRVLERRLLGSEPVRIAFDVRSEGAVESSLRGMVALDGGGRARLEAEGTFRGEPVELRLVSDGGGMRMVGGADSVLTSTPPALREALAVGFMRMGILHNLARLTGPAEPDHADGGAAEWARVLDLRRAEVSEDAPEGLPVTFDIEVAGRPAGTGTVVIADDGTPVVRFQTVDFPQGRMRVEERYTEVGFGRDAVSPDLFRLGS